MSEKFRENPDEQKAPEARKISREVFDKYVLENAGIHDFAAEGLSQKKVDAYLERMYRSEVLSRKLGEISASIATEVYGVHIPEKPDEKSKFSGVVREAIEEISLECVDMGDEDDEADLVMVDFDGELDERSNGDKVIQRRSFITTRSGGKNALMENVEVQIDTKTGRVYPFSQLTVHNNSDGSKLDVNQILPPKTHFAPSKIVNTKQREKGLHNYQGTRNGGKHFESRRQKKNNSEYGRSLR